MWHNLPKTTQIKRVIPKNAFDEYTNTKQKKNFTDWVKRITWLHKLSPETINLEAKEIEEIQLFKIELKQEENIKKLLEIIDKAIPYHIIFWVEYEEKAYLSTASKHKHPTNENIAVIDWVFTTDWFDKEKCKYQLNLKQSLDAVFKDICIQLSGNKNYQTKTLENIVNNEAEKAQLTNQIKKLKAQIKRTKQFNKKVELNQELNKLSKQLIKYR